MKHTFIILIAALALSVQTYARTDGNAQQQPSDNRNVYICTGSNSKKWHNSRNCSGLNNCKGEIKAVLLAKVKGIKKYTGPCKKCSRGEIKQQQRSTKRIKRRIR